MTVGEDLQAINDELWSERSEPWDAPYKVLCHYTDSAGLKGIAQSRRLWSRDVRFMNDTGETSYGRSLCDEALRKHDRTGQITRGLFERMSGLEEIQVFCTSFCEEEDELSQWRAYGSDNGFSLGIKIPTFDFKPDFRNIQNFAVLGVLDPVLIKIDYSLEHQIALVDQVFSKLISLYDRVQGTSSTGPFFASLFRHYVDLSLRLKSPAFKSETEWRVIWVTKSDFPPFYSSRREDLIKEASAILYRPSSGGFIPHLDYIRIAAFVGSDEPFSLVSVVQGPRTSPDQYLVSLRGFLKQCRLLYDIDHLREGKGFKEIPLRCSAVPLRMR